MQSLKFQALKSQTLKSQTLKSAGARLVKLMRAEFAVTAALGVLAAAVLAFAEITDEVGEGESAGFDQAVLEALRVPGDPAEPVGPAWFDLAVFDLTALGSIAVLVTVALIAGGYLMLCRQYGKAALLGVALGGGVVLSEALKGVFARSRPPEAYWMADAVNHSYPSGHALLSAVVYLTIGVMLARAVKLRTLRIYVVAAATMLVVVVGLSRVYLGVHWTTDVLAGWSVGAAWACVLWLVAGGLRRREGSAAPREGVA